mgnify:CR=1 FL=1
MKTTVIKPADAVKRWVVVDATDQVLGRLASAIARVLRGKRRADYTPHVDQGDCVIVLNVGKIRLTGDKLNQKMLKRYSGYPGGLKLIPYSELMVTRPQTALRRAVWGMLSRSRQSRKQIRSLKIYKGGDHPHVAQQPTTVKLVNGELTAA